MNPYRPYKNNSYILGISSNNKKAITGNVIWEGVPVVKINNTTLQAKYQILSHKILSSIIWSIVKEDSEFKCLPLFQEFYTNNDWNGFDVRKWNNLYILFYTGKEGYYTKEGGFAIIEEDDDLVKEDGVTVEEVFYLDRSFYTKGWHLRECNSNDLINIYTQGLSIAPKFFRDLKFQEKGNTFSQIWDCADEILESTEYSTSQGLYYLFRLITLKYKLKGSLFCFRQGAKYNDVPCFSIEIPNRLNIEMAKSILEFCDRYKLDYNIDFIDTPSKSGAYHVEIMFYDAYPDYYNHNEEDNDDRSYSNIERKRLLDYNWERNCYMWEIFINDYHYPDLTYCHNIRDFIDKYNSFVHPNNLFSYTVKNLKNGCVYKISKNSGTERDLLKEMLLLYSAKRWIELTIDGERKNLLEITMFCTFMKRKTEITVVEKQKIQLQDDDDNDYDDYSYTEEELESMYRDAFEGDPEAIWNID